MDFPTEENIFEDLWAYFTGQLPDVTFKRKGGVAWALLRTAAYGLRVFGLACVEKLYAAIWPQFADREACRNFYELYEMVWDPNLALPKMRDAILARVRAGVIGTAAWYEREAVRAFDEVTSAVALPGRRGPNTLDLVVSNGGRDVMDLDAVQAYFDDPERLVLAADVRVLQPSQIAAEAAGAADYWGRDD